MDPIGAIAGPERRGVTMEVSFQGESGSGRLRWFREGLRSTLEERERDGAPGGGPVVFYFFDGSRPRSFRRGSKDTFVVGVTAVNSLDGGALETAYPLLVRTLSNLLVLVVDDGSEREAHFVTPEQGHYVVQEGEAEERFFDEVYQRIEPLASSTLVIENEFREDLPPELHGGDEVTEALARAGERLDALDLLPAPFPLEEILSPGDLRHLNHLFGIGGLSYGNLSARKDPSRFWMSASGVDKSQLREVGRDVLLVTGYDREANAILLSVPPDVEPRRVSVDAIEHWMIYEEHPSVKAIVHVHAWMEGVEATRFNYPCGTYELAKAVAGIVREAEDPARAVVGLKNHGLTITGRSLDDIFDRVEGRIQRQIPME